jgi:hypothetical protein
MRATRLPVAVLITSKLFSLVRLSLRVLEGDSREEGAPGPVESAAVVQVLALAGGGGAARGGRAGTE